MTMSNSRTFMIATLALASVVNAQTMTLAQAHALALKNNIPLQEARQTWLTNQYDQNIAWSYLLPQATNASELQRNKTVFDGYSNINETTRFYNLRDLNLTLTQELFNMNSYYLYSQASQKATQDLLIYQRALQELTLTISEQYFDLALAIDDYHFLIAEEKETLQRLEDIKNQLNFGAMTKSQLLEVQAQAQRVHADIIEAKQAVQNKKDVLSDSIGEANFQKIMGIGKKPRTLALTIPKLQHWINDTEANNLTLKIMGSGVLQAHYSQQAAQSNYLPTLSFNTAYHNYNFSSQSVKIEGSGSPQTWLTRRGYDTLQGSIKLSLPLLDGGKRYYDNKKASANVRLTEVNAKNTQQDIMRHLKKLYRALKHGSELIATKQAALKSSSEMSRISQVSLQAGAVTVLEALENIKNVRSDQKNLAVAQYGYLYSLIEILIQAGIISPKDISDIDKDLNQEILIPE